jgi:hypothetical protein
MHHYDAKGKDELSGSKTPSSQGRGTGGDRAGFRIAASGRPGGRRPVICWFTETAAVIRGCRAFVHQDGEWLVGRLFDSVISPWRLHLWFRPAGVLMHGTAQ